MRIGRIGRGLGLALAVLTALSVMALPAAAAAAKGTASIDPDQRQVLAGEVGAQFDITVSNPAGPGGLLSQPNPSYNAIRIVPPANAYTATSASGPGDWTARTNSLGHLFFEGGTIADGQSATFSVVADVARTGCDLARTWDVYVSDDGGQTSVRQDPASPGALTTSIRVLEVVGVELVAPSGVVDNSATEQQSGILARTTVLNAGSDDLSVSATLGKGSGNAGAPTTSPADANPKTIASGTQGTFDFDVTMGSAGNLELVGDASAANCADALNGLSDTISVMTKAAFNYVGGSLEPTHVVPGKPYSFSTRINKSGQVAASLDTASSTFRFPAGDPSYTATLTDNASVPGGGQSLTFTFSEEIVPLTLPDGSYQPEILLVGTDENDAVIGTTDDPYEVSVTNQVTLDRLIPFVDPTLDPPDSQVIGAEDATTNGATLGFGGKIEDPAGSPCGGCTIVSAVLRQYDAAGNAIHNEPVNPTNTAGLIGGSFNGNYAAGAVEVALVVTARDQAGNQAEGASDRVDVDNVDPGIAKAVVGGPSGQNARRVDVSLTELVAVPVACSPADWTVDGNVVTAAECQPLPGGHNRVVLTLQNEMPSDGEGTLTYQPVPESNRRHDRVALDLATVSVPIEDGLIPDLPVLNRISGLDKFDGQFWSNESSPDFSITEVAAGYTVKVWHDVNDDGQIDAGDREIASGEAQGNSVDLEAHTTVGTDNAEGTGFDAPLLVQALDTNLNSSALADELLTIDQTAPEFESAMFLGNDVTVTINDVLRFGRDFTWDWSVRQGSGNTAQDFGPESVSGSRESRTLTINHPDYDPAQVNLVAYNFLGAEDQRYADRAGNALADFNASVSGL